MKSYLPDRKVLSGGVAGLAAYAVVLVANASGAELGFEEATGIVGSATVLTSYLVPPSVADIVKRVDQEIVEWYEELVSGTDA